MSLYQRYGKRLLDLAFALPALILVSPLLALLAVSVWCTLGPPVLFRHRRAGLRSRPFTLLKFRTMTDARDPAGVLLPDAERLTPFGGLLRSTSLDELPQLLNVLKGEMSLVGPRPLLVEYLDRYTPEQIRRHEVKPGITGWAQVNGRNALTWEEKFALDVWYVDHCSFRLDLKIAILTVWKIFTREGINHPGQATMEEYRGPAGSQPLANFPDFAPPTVPVASYPPGSSRRSGCDSRS
jgi:lipopolysaccharide/colanic/teichoic acid biosynthesis glycosyltransferase